MNTKQLRQKILDLAIKGKLVPQDPNDEPASKLLERIREEKERLINEGKLKRDKNESYIFVGDDKLHYEKFADGSIVCIEDEIPFEIPESWAWCRLRNVIELISGQDLQPSQYNDEGRGILYITGASCIENEKLKKNRWTECPKSISIKNDILISCKGSIGTIAINTEDEVHIARQIMAIRTNIYCYNLFIKILIQNIVPFMQSKSKGVIPGIERKDILDFLVAIPPQSEQQRISETIETLLKLVDLIESDKIDLSDLIKQTKSKVLDLAIKGKLVPQDPNDEPADKLLERIREEKEKLIKEGKLKRDKNETYIFKNSDDNSYYEKIDGETVCIDDDLPFEIPENWRWTKFCNICDIARGGSPRPIEKYITNDADGINWIKIGDTEKGGKYIYSTKEKIKREGIGKSRYVKPGDFLLTNSMSFGRPYILKIDGCIHDGWLVINDNFRVFDQDFLYYLLSSNVMYQLLSIAAKGSTVKNLKSDTVKIVIMPVPPKNEQILISKKIESIFTQLDIIQEIFLQ